MAVLCDGTVRLSDSSMVNTHMRMAKDIFLSPKSLIPFMTDEVGIIANRKGAIHQWTVLACPFEDLDQEPASEFSSETNTKRMLFIIRKSDLVQNPDIGDIVEWNDQRWGVYETINDSATITLKTRLKKRGGR